MIMATVLNKKHSESANFHRAHFEIVPDNFYLQVRPVPGIELKFVQPFLRNVAENHDIAARWR